MESISIQDVSMEMAGYLQDVFWGDGEGPEIDFDEWHWLIYRGGKDIEIPLIEVDPRVVVKKANLDAPLVQGIANEYEVMLEDGLTAPPILLEGDELIDGIHRCFAAIQAGRKTVEAAVVKDEAHGKAIGLKLLGKLP